MLLLKGLHEEAFEIATAHAHKGEHEQALAMFKRLLEERPEEPAVRYNYAVILEKLELNAEALKQYRMLSEELPEYGNAAIGYARMLEQGRQYCCAVGVLRLAAAASPEDSQVAAALGNSLIMAGEPETALLWYRVALTLSSNDRTVISNFLYTLLMVSDISANIVAKELQLSAAYPLLAIKLANAARQLHDLNSNKITTFHTTFGSILKGDRSERRFPAGKSHGDRIRIGYISADLYSHPVGYFLEGVLPNHDRQRWEVFVFAPYAERDQLTAKLKSMSDHWFVLDGSNRDCMRKQVQECGLDIAVDLAGHTGGNYLDLFAQGLAPIQIAWGGYPGTTGLSAMDYIIADHVALPPEEESFYAERALRLPHDYVSFVPPEKAPLPGPLPATTRGVITFGSFNTVQKLSSNTLVLWGGVLRAIPDSRLFLKAKGFDDPQVCSAFLQKLAAEGVTPERVYLEGYSSRLDVMTAYKQVDVALDPVPYQGGVTVLEALWMGVPTLVLRGGRPPFVRHGESHLSNVGLADWIAASEEEYIAKAVAWSRDLPGLATLRSRLRQQTAVSPICDTAGFTRDLEATFERALRDSTLFSGRGTVPEWL